MLTVRRVFFGIAAAAGLSLSASAQTTTPTMPSAALPPLVSPATEVPPVATAPAVLPAAERAAPVGPLPVPTPVVWDIQRRSGLITRFARVPATLPPDPKRDTFYRTRYDDWYHPNPRGRNLYVDGGLYGKPWPSDCTACVSPSFTGSPGKSTFGPDCVPPTQAGRYIGNLIHPFRPVGMYYDRGVYGPVYDLDPIAPGPGPFPWNHYIKRPMGG
jgi:hypothetical protein